MEMYALSADIYIFYNADLMQFVNSSIIAQYDPGRQNLLKGIGAYIDDIY